jgi:hypothetical protein
LGWFHFNFLHEAYHGYYFAEMEKLNDNSQ